MVAAACSSNNGGGSSNNGGGSTASNAEITIAIGSEPTTLDPQLRDDGGERAVTDNIYETLMARTADGQLVPGLAADAPTQPDATTWEFKLRDGITFTDGEPFNADAVVYSVERIIDPKFQSEQSGFFSTITGAKKVDDLTVDILTNGPDPILPSRMYWMKMVPPEASKNADFADDPVGTGPYKFVEWTKGDHVTLERNPDYWGDEPSIAKVTYQFPSESGARLSGLLAGDFDLVTNLLPEDVQTVEGAGMQVAHVQGLEHPVLILNARGGITADERVRQALNYAVDKDAIVNSLFGGFGVPDQCQLLSPSWFGFDPSLQAYPYDPNKAKDLLQQAGAEGQTIQLVGESGRWLKDRELIEAVANYWQAVGLKVDVKIYTFDEYLNRLFDQKNRADAIFVSSSNELLDADRGYSTYYEQGGVGSSNDDPQLKQLIDSARTETDSAKRLADYQQASQIACQKAYFVWLLNNEDIYGMSSRLQWTPRVDAKLLVKEMSVTS
ncbi:MAG TPA: ABC transporter substrate-binding protein [Actinomycetota bacterium]